MNFPSKLIENAVNEFAKLPGIGKKTALRLVLHLLKEEEAKVAQFGEAIVTMRKDIQFCKKCHNIADKELCSICENQLRKQDLVCVVESFRDVIAIEQTEQYRGVYHVLGGVISPVDGVGPDHLNVESLVKRVEEDGVKEVIMALNPTMEGDTTIFYLSKRLKNFEVTITTIARGVAFGGELEYVDEMTLARSIVKRLPYERYLK